VNMRTGVCLLVQLMAFWPIWIWYVRRLFGPADEPLGLLPLLTAAAILYSFKPVTCDEKGAMRNLGMLGWSSLITIVYAAAYAYLPTLVSAGLAVVAIGLTISRICFRTHVHAGVIGLLILSLPVLHSFQFYGGYPLRLIVASCAGRLLSLNGTNVVIEGTGFVWGDIIVAVDAPCSGITMLWTGLYLALTLASIYQFSFWKTAASSVIALLLVVAGNIIRAMTLFYTEAGIYHVPAYLHEGVGMAAFAMTAIAIVLTMNVMRRKWSCVAYSALWVRV